jgi:hypothetical protein
MSVTASLQAGVLRIEGATGADTINVRYLNGNYSVDGLTQSFAGSQVQSIRIDGNGGNDRINLHTEGYSTAGNTTANFVGPAQNGATIVYQPITVPTQIYGGSGNDIIDGGEGPDTIFGRAGADTIRGWAGADYIDGGLDNDNIQGGAGADTIFGDLGNDTIDGGADSDRIFGGPEANTIVNSTTGDQILSNELIQGLVVDPALRERIRYLQIDGVLSRNDMLSVFTQVESDNVVSLNEFNDLQRVEGAGAFLGMPDSVLVLTNKVINYDAANKQFAGAALEADGRLHAGDTSAEFSLLVSKWFYGADHPLAQNHAKSVTYGYAYATGPLFATASGSTLPNPTIGNVLQGSELNDDAFLSNLAGLTEHNRSALTSMFTDNGDGTFTVRLYTNGRADYVTVDRYLPVQSQGYLIFAHSGQGHIGSSDPIWVALAEKAYAQFNASGTIGHDGTNSYQGIAGGDSTAAYAQITGATQDSHDFDEYSSFDIASAFFDEKVVTIQTNSSSTLLNRNDVYVVLSMGTRFISLYSPGQIGFGAPGDPPHVTTIPIDDLAANAVTWYSGH